tara:strand:- start:1171 stop:1383 length:213 start_codon:yes stop_codon:yes gene_type:complete
MKLYKFKLVENGTGRERTVSAEAASMQEAISRAYVSANQWLAENSKRWQIVSAEDRTYTHEQRKKEALNR